MRLSSYEAEINTENPFNEDINTHGRLDLANLLIDILGAVSEPTTIILDAQWGDGKTYFLNRIPQLMEPNRISSIYFDAFKYDYYDDPLIPLSGQILEHLDQNAPASSSKATFSKSAAKLARKIGPKLAGRLVKVATAGLIEASDVELLDHIKSAISDTSEDATEEVLTEEISNFSAQKAIEENFRNSLTQIARDLSKAFETKDEEVLDEPSHAPLVILIDELDRAKPTFALNLLERIKHFFDVPNVHFLIAVHMRQLESSVRGVYGESIEARSYLEKFYTLLLQFPSPSENRPDSKLKTIAKKQLQIVGVSIDNSRWINRTAAFLSCLAQANGWSFRTLQKVSTHVGLSLCTGDSIEDLEIPVLCGLWATKITDNDLYARLKRGERVGDRFQRSVSMDKWKGKLSDTLLARYSNVWNLLASNGPLALEAQQSIEGSLGIHEVSDYLVSFCARYIDTISRFSLTPSNSD